MNLKIWNMIALGFYVTVIIYIFYNIDDFIFDKSADVDNIYALIIAFMLIIISGMSSIFFIFYFKKNVNYMMNTITLGLFLIIFNASSFIESMMARNS